MGGGVQSQYKPCPVHCGGSGHTATVFLSRQTLWRSVLQRCYPDVCLIALTSLCLLQAAVVFAEHRYYGE